MRTAELLHSCGLEVPFESSGRRDSRSSSGSLVRFWASLWFCSMRDSEGLGWVFEKDDLERIEERVQIVSTLFTFKKVRGQKLPLTDIDGKGALAILDVDRSSSSSSSSSSCSSSTSSDSAACGSHRRRNYLVAESSVRTGTPQDVGGTVAIDGLPS